MSIPSSRMTAMASGRTWVGRVPALNTSKRLPAMLRKRPSAIWLRAELPVQRMRTRFLSGIGFVEWDEPPKERSGGGRARQLGGDESGCIDGADAGEGVGYGAGQGNGGVGEGS